VIARVRTTAQSQVKSELLREMLLTLSKGQIVSNITVVKLRSAKTPFSWRISDTPLIGTNRKPDAVSAEITANLRECRTAKANIGEATSRIEE